jgi:hypothetical protein
MEVGAFRENAETMITDLPIKFLQQKVQELQSALFFPETGTLLQIPTHVVTAAEVDEEGHIWFVIPRPAQHIDASDSTFPAKLDFFRKGKGFFLKVTGTACIICESEQVPTNGDTLAHVKHKLRNRQAVAIKVSIHNADYFESANTKGVSRMQPNKYQQFFSWLLMTDNQTRGPQLITIPIPAER